MQREYGICSLSNAALIGRLGEVASRDNSTTAEMLAVLAEVERRKLHRAEGWDSLFRYCVDVLHMSGDMADKRIQVARATRQFPRLLERIAEGRLHLTGALRLVPHLTRRNADELLDAATHRTTAEILQMLAERFPAPDLPTVLRPAGMPGTAVPTSAADIATGHPSVAVSADSGARPVSIGPTDAEASELVSKPVVPSNAQEAPMSTEPLPAFTRVQPLAPGRFALQCTLSQDVHELLRYARSLLGHAVPDGDVPAVLERALRALVEQLERRQFGVGARLRAVRDPKDPRWIAPEVRREVFLRDGGQCTFVGDSGHRCESRTRLQFHHIQPFGKGGASTADNLTLHCGPHNREQAKRDYGEAGMSEGRERGERRPLRLHVEPDLAGDARASAMPPVMREQGRTAAAAASRSWIA